MSDKIPKDYKDLPHFPNDQLSDDYSDGDIMIQACSMDDQVTFHAIHNLIRPFRDVVQVKWFKQVSYQANFTKHHVI